MLHTTAAFFALTTAIGCSGALGAEPPPYVGQESRHVKSLSSEEVDGLLSGKGMGFAKAAELNHYPGPAHVLELASELHLTAEQRAATERLFRSMQTKAKALGEELVRRESELDRLFATRSITPDVLARLVAEIGSLQGRLRGIHLEAHLTQADLLSPDQRNLYDELRGYHTQPASTEHEHHH